MPALGWSSVTPGRSIILVGNLFYSVGAFAADWSETHVFNPRWPPHAKFHNGQTMTLGVLLAASSTYYALRPTSTAATARDSLFTAALIGTFYCLAGVCAIAFPGTDWKDPEFAWPEGGPQKYVFSATCAAMWLGYWLDAERVGKGKAM